MTPKTGCTLYIRNDTKPLRSPAERRVCAAIPNARFYSYGLSASPRNGGKGYDFTEPFDFRELALTLLEGNFT